VTQDAGYGVFIPMMLLLLACSPKDADSSSTEDTGAALWTETRAVLDENCARCHTEGGQAPSFDDPATAQALAATMVAYTAEGRMPPAAPDPECAPYEGSDTFTLDDAEKATLVAWADAGAPIGDAEANPPASGPTTAPFDLELFGSQAYTPSFGGDGNDYRCFLLEVGNDSVTYLTGMEALVDQLSIVHHVVIFSVNNHASIPTDGDPTEGFACSGLGEQGWDFVGAWAPGANPVIFPDGSGMRLQKNAELVLQMHYFDSFDGADQVADRSGYGLHLADSVDRKVYQYPYGPTGFTIPAGEEAYEVSDSYDWSGPDMDILGVWPHMHVLGAGFDERVEHADGSTTCLLHQDGWNFHNQVFARLDTPVTATSGDRVDVTCTYNNSASNPDQLANPPVDVDFGEETNNEMCFGFTYVIERE
jgi:mono/diheme cytochrome c family protein